jgi:hypothetical protein
MAGINYRKVAEAAEEKGKLKKAADFYVQAGDRKKAYELYEKVLSKTNDKFVIEDIASRLTRLNLSKSDLKYFQQQLIPQAKKRSLERHVGYSSFAILSILSLLGALFFVSVNLTGNAIGAINENNSNWIGFCFFACGLILALVHFKRKENKK